MSAFNYLCFEGLGMGIKLMLNLCSGCICKTKIDFSQTDVHLSMEIPLCPKWASFWVIEFTENCRPKQCHPPFFQFSFNATFLIYNILS